MLCHTTWLITRLDHIYLSIARWQVQLSEYDIQHVSQKAIKGSVIAKFLAERALEEYEPIDFDFSDEDLMTVTYVEEESSKKNCWRLYFDVASNALGDDIDAILITSEGEYYLFTARLDFNCTNNVTKYKACAMGLQATVDKTVKNLKCMVIRH